MIDKELTHRRNVIIFKLIALFYGIQVAVNIAIEGAASVFPPVFMFLIG